MKAGSCLAGILCALALAASAHAGKGTVKDNQVELLLKIPDTVPESQAFIDELKSWYTSASAYLHASTNQQARFSKLTIFIPDSWTTIKDVKPLDGMNPDDADIKISTLEPDAAYATGLGGFTRSGHVSFGTGVLKWATADRTLVHEFGHYGFGLGDEYCDLPAGGGQRFRDASGRWIRCTEKTEFETTVEFTRGGYDYVKHDSKGEKASIMWMQHENSIVTWCDKSNHYAAAQSYHNRMNGNKSCWEVMEANPLFNLKAPGSTGATAIPNTAPVFEIRQGGAAVISVVIDHSGSMGDDNKMEQAKVAAQIFVNQMDNNRADYLGVVAFDDSAASIFPVTKIDNEGAKASARAAISLLQPDGGTSIAAGLSVGLQQVMNASAPAATRAIVLLSDGLAPFPTTEVATAIAEKIPVFTVALGSDADTSLLRKVAADTLAGYFFAAGGGELAQIYTEIQKRIGAPTRNISGKSKSATAGEVVALATPLDSTVTQANFTAILADANDATLLLTGPGLSVRSTDASLPANVKLTLENGFVSFLVIGPGAGDWNAQLTNGNAPQDVQLQVSGDSSIHISGGTIPELVENGEPFKIYATAMDEGTPIAGLAAVAIVTAPDGTTVEVPLHDDGVSGDSISDDGTYSAVFTGYSGYGDYGITVRVSNAALDGRYGTGYIDIPPGGVTNKEAERKMVGEDFERITVLPSVTVEYVPFYDETPPGKIDSFEIAEVLPNRTLSITWVSPGDDAYDGTASSYELRYSDKPISSDDDWDAAGVVEGLDAPRPAGSVEAIELNNIPFGELYLALRASDEEGNVSEISNNISFELAGARLTIQVEGSGSTNPIAGVYEHALGESITISANPASGWIFKGWQGDVNSPSQSITFAMDRDKTVRAVFQQKSGISCAGIGAGPDSGPVDAALLLVTLAMLAMARARQRRV